MRIEIKTAPANPATSLASITSQGFINTTKLDTMISNYIPSATTYVEHYTGRKLIDQVVYLYFDRDEYFNRLAARNNSILLSTLNVNSIVEVTEFDIENNSTVLNSANYRLSGNNLSSANYLVFNDTYTPVNNNYRTIDAIRIELNVGYGSAEANLPEQILVALNQLIAYWAKNGDYATSDQKKKTPIGFEQALRPFTSTEMYF